MNRLVAWGLLAVLTGFATPDPLKLAPIASAMNFDHTDTVVQWRDCGVINAYYHPLTHRVTMCNELLALDPGVIRFVLAHELAHGVIDQLEIPVIGSQEVAADELATVILTVSGHANDAVAAANWFLETADPENPADPHSGDVRRGLAIGCLVLQHARKDSPFCTGNSWTYTVSTWNTLLGIEGQSHP